MGVIERERQGEKERGEKGEGEGRGTKEGGEDPAECPHPGSPTEGARLPFFVLLSLFCKPEILSRYRC